MSTRDVSDDELQLAQKFGWAARNAGADYLHARVLPDGRIVCLLPLFFGALRLGIGPRDSQQFDDVWDYLGDEPGIDCGWLAAIGWDGEGEPEGWYRHHRTGRRRPGGDPAKEVING
jgi:hypothetical protein